MVETAFEEFEWDSVLGAEGEMRRHESREHQPEPWTQDGRYVLDASGWTLASTRFPADARRIVAAVNAVQGIPTESLESWSDNVIGEPAQALVAAGDRSESPDLEIFPEDRRANNRRHGDRRGARH
jgi:hypothetical protein